MNSYEIQGRTITLPVQVRRARTWAAQFLVAGFVVVCLISGLPNAIARIFGAKLYDQPNWLPVMEFPWWICFGSIVTFFVAISFRTGREHLPHCR